MIYFIKRDDGLVKIGTTTNFYRRLASLKKEHGELGVMGWHNGDYKTEKEIHQKFSAYRIIDEWFYFSDELSRYLIENANKGEPPKPDKGLSTERLYQVILERDAFIQKQNEQIEEMSQRLANVRELGTKLLEIIKEIQEETLYRKNKIQDLETKLAFAERQLHLRASKKAS